MISFELLSALVRGLFALWALLLCLVNIFNAVLAFVKKHYRIATFAIILFAPSYFMWQMIFDFSLLEKTGHISAITDKAIAISWVYWLILFIVLTIAAILVLGLNIRYDKTYISTGTIKLYLDKIPCGICCWRENGRVLFSNDCMNELCIAITDNPLLNGNQFRDAVKDGILTVNATVWRFVCHEIEMDNERLYEMIASNITAEYANTVALEEDKALLSKLNKELQEYYLSIDESVRRQEILQAKMNIHDEMNRLMLSTVAADEENTEALNRIFSLWEQNALLLCMEANKKTAKEQANSLNALAKSLGIELIWKDALPNFITEKQKELFFFTAQEALINAVKHASAKTIEISFEKNRDENTVLCRFTNDGIKPSKEVHFEGGLANIALLAEKQNASVSTEIKDGFSLILCLSL